MRKIINFFHGKLLLSSTSSHQFLCTECPSLCAQTVGPRLKVKVSLESLVNGLSCPQRGKMGSDDSFWSQIGKMQKVSDFEPQKVAQIDNFLP